MSAVIVSRLHVLAPGALLALAAVACASPTPTATPAQPATPTLTATPTPPCSGADDPNDALYQGVK